MNAKTLCKLKNHSTNIRAGNAALSHPMPTSAITRNFIDLVQDEILAQDYS